LSDWLDVMLEEIARKRREAEEAREELERRRDESSREASADEDSQRK